MVAKSLRCGKHNAVAAALFGGYDLAFLVLAAIGLARYWFAMPETAARS